MIGYVTSFTTGQLIVAVQKCCTYRWHLQIDSHKTALQPRVSIRQHEDWQSKASRDERRSSIPPPWHRPNPVFSLPLHLSRTPSLDDDDDGTLPLPVPSYRWKMAAESREVPPSNSSINCSMNFRVQHIKFREKGWSEISQ